jgi:hypothetical protein
MLGGGRKAVSRAMRVHRSGIALVVVLLLASAACGSDDDDDAATGSTTTTTSGSTTTSTTASPTTTGVEATTTAPPAGGGVLVELATSGGIDGRGMGNLVVSTTGEVRHTGRDGQVDQDTLDSGELDALTDLLASTDFAGLPDEPEAICADGLLYTVLYQQQTGEADSCTVPDGLAPVLDNLRDLLSRFD